MRFSLVFVFAAVIILGFLTFMLTYTVRFTEVAVVTTFGSAGEDDVIRDAGMKWRMPYPINKVTKYDTRARLIQTSSETQQTADNLQVVAGVFAAWRVSDPLRFFQRFGVAGSDARDHYRAAERTIEQLLRSAMSEISAYRFDELFTTSGSKLEQFETAVLNRLRSADEPGRGLAEYYGIDATSVGVNRLVLPSETTEAVFARMKAQRVRLASVARSQGEAAALTIINDAYSASDRIRAFAQQRAEQIRVQGELEAARYYEQLNQEKDLAIFIDQLDFMKSLYGKRSTLVLSTDQMGLSIFSPDALTHTNANGVPLFSPSGAPVASDQPAKQVSSGSEQR